MPTAWVTGARGFIGRRLAVELRRQGLEVCGVGHGHLPADLWERAGLGFWLNSQLTAEALDRLATHGLPQTLFHLAGGSMVGASIQAPLEDFTRTTAATAGLLEWLRNHSPQTKVVVASSAAVYGGTDGASADESTPANPVSPYGYHKWMMEQLCREYAHLFGLQMTVLRLFSVYGEGLRKQLLWDCAIKLTSEGDAVRLGGTGEELRDWVHVDDAVEMLIRVASLADASCPLFNGGSGSGVAVREIVSLLANALQRPKRIEFSGVSRPGDPVALVADCRKLGATGYVSRIPLPEGVRRYADWFVDAGRNSGIRPRNE